MPLCRHRNKYGNLEVRNGDQDAQTGTMALQWLCYDVGTSRLADLLRCRHHGMSLVAKRRHPSITAARPAVSSVSSMTGWTDLNSEYPVGQALLGNLGHTNRRNRALRGTHGKVQCVSYVSMWCPTGGRTPHGADHLLRPDLEVSACIAHGVGLFIFIADDGVSIGSNYTMEALLGIPGSF